MNHAHTTPDHDLPPDLQNAAVSLHDAGIGTISEPLPAVIFEPEQQQQLMQGCAAWNIALPQSASNQLAQFAQMLYDVNRTLNLTRVPPEQTATRHYLDSLALAAVYRPPAGARLLDVGTGAGFPGVPLAIAYPGLDVTLMDSTRKRLDFLDAAIQAVDLPNARTLLGRAETLARDPQHRARYDIVVARAVAALPTLAGWLLPFARPGGLVVAYKSQAAGEEVEQARQAIATLGGTLEQVADVLLPGTDIIRSLVVIRKIARPDVNAVFSARRAAQRRRR